jgi:hypothetical protein
VAPRLPKNRHSHQRQDQGDEAPAQTADESTDPGDSSPEGTGSIAHREQHRRTRTEEKEEAGLIRVGRHRSQCPMSPFPQRTLPASTRADCFLHPDRCRSSRPSDRPSSYSCQLGLACYFARNSRSHLPSGQFAAARRPDLRPTSQKQRRHCVSCPSEWLDSSNTGRERRFFFPESRSSQGHRSHTI